MPPINRSMNLSIIYVYYIVSILYYVCIWTFFPNPAA